MCDCCGAAGNALGCSGCNEERKALCHPLQGVTALGWEQTQGCSCWEQNSFGMVEVSPRPEEVPMAAGLGSLSWLCQPQAGQGCRRRAGPGFSSQELVLHPPGRVPRWDPQCGGRKELRVLDSASDTALPSAQGILGKDSVSAGLSAELLTLEWHRVNYL